MAMTIEEKYRSWCEHAVEDADVATELREMEQDEAKKEDAFYRELAFGTEFSVRKTAQILSLQRESVPSRWRRAAADRCGKIAVHLWDRERRCLPEPIGRRHPA